MPTEWQPGVALVAGREMPVTAFEIWAAGSMLWLVVTFGLWAAVGPHFLVAGAANAAGVAIGMAVLEARGLRASLRARRTRQYVQPGPNTFGIYAMHDRDEVPAAVIVAQILLVRGTVHLWGDTYEHEAGVKGQYAYPSQILDALCAVCHEWFPLADYLDETRPPQHCLPRRWWERVRWKLASMYWQRPGLVELKAAAPEWFEEGA